MSTNTCLLDRYNTPSKFLAPDTILIQENDSKTFCDDLRQTTLSLCLLTVASADEILKNVHNTLMASKCAMPLKMMGCVLLSSLALSTSILAIPESLVRFALAIIIGYPLQYITEERTNLFMTLGKATLYHIIGGVHSAYQYLSATGTIEKTSTELFLEKY